MKGGGKGAMGRDADGELMQWEGTQGAERTVDMQGQIHG